MSGNMETNKCSISSTPYASDKCNRIVRDIWASGYCRYRQCGHETSHMSTHIGSKYDTIINGKTSQELKIDNDPQNGLVNGIDRLSLDDENYLAYHSEVLLENGISPKEEDDLYEFKLQVEEQLKKINQSVEEVSSRFNALLK